MDHKRGRGYPQALAQTHIKSMRMFTDEFRVFSSVPSNHLLSGRESNEAYCLVRPGNQYAVYFPDGGKVSLDMTGHDGQLTLKWLNVMTNEWTEGIVAEAGRITHLQAPGRGPWIAVYKASH